ncbi:hypothetical protein BDR07DRAFT_48840 [Suillus spraguei]|nr:hypothetical protein BDR07DRAFT_48840 [Suillus spraguei]
MYSFGNIFLQVLTRYVPWVYLTCKAAILRRVVFVQEIHSRPDDCCVIEKFWNFMMHCWSIVPTIDQSTFRRRGT